jgi:hypothetical protein
MRLFVLILAVGVGLIGLCRADDTKAKEVKFEQATGYFESNKSGLEGEASYLAFASQDSFGKVLLPRPPLMGKKSKLLPKDVFEKNLVVSVIKRGTTTWQYKVEKMAVQAGTLTVEYKALQQGAGGGTAKFASPMVVAIEKGEYKEIIFVENGKKAGTATIGK